MAAPSSANVELLFNPRDLDPSALTLSAGALGKPHEVLSSALISTRLLMLNQMKSELASQTRVNAVSLLQIVDVAWRLFLPRWKKLSAPLIADAYLRAYQQAGAGDVPISVVYALAEQHAERMGEYFHETSKEALTQGFNTFINRKVAEKAAADQVLDAYGMTPRQMRAYTAMLAVETKVDSPAPRSLKGRALEYISRSIQSRFKVFADQELHNIDEQAQQFAWMWLQDKGKLSPRAEKVWITAKDERVCKICGPLHGKRVKVGEQFETSAGKIWTPGTHPNCRCHVRLIANQFSLVEKADWDPKEHPRGGDPENRGRFSAKARTKATAPKPRPIKEREREDLSRLQAFLNQSLADLKVTEQEEKKVSLPSKVSLPKKVSLPGKVSLPSKVSLEQKVSLATPTTEKVKISVPLAEKISIRQETERLFTELKTTRKTKRYYRPTIKLDRPVYTVVSAKDFDRDGKIELTPDHTFVSNKKQAAVEAAELFEAQIEQEADDIQISEMNRIERYVAGEKWIAVINSQDIYNVVSYVAYQNGADPDWRGDDKILVDWMNGRGELIGAPEPMRYSELAERWGLEPEQFEVAVLVMQEGHDSSLGSTVNESIEGDHHYESWIATGTYTSEPDRAAPIGRIPMTFYDIYPDVETEVQEYDE